MQLYRASVYATATFWDECLPSIYTVAKSNNFLILNTMSPRWTEVQWLAQARPGTDEPALGILMSWLLDRRKWRTTADHGACSRRTRQHDDDDHMLVQQPRVVQLLVGRGMGCVEAGRSKVAA